VPLLPVPRDKTSAARGWKIIAQLRIVVSINLETNYTFVVQRYDQKTGNDDVAANGFLAAGAASDLCAP
jgi:hypothetical protein